MKTDVNKEMKMTHGNYKYGPSPFLDVVTQNLLGTTSIPNLQIYTETLLSRYRPAVLIITEAPVSKMQHVSLPGYTWIQGIQERNKNPRISLFVQTCLPHEVLHLVCQLPLVAIRLGDINVVGLYREWTSYGSKTPANQLSRSLTLAPLLQTIRGKSLICGDFNFCYRDSSSQHQHSLNDIRELYHNILSSSGWKQWISKFTRYQKGQVPALLDQVYTKQLDIDRVFTKNIVGTDHSMVGVRVALQKPLFQPRSFSKRDIDNVDVESFARHYLSNQPYELDPSNALKVLEDKILDSLDYLAPLKTYQTRVRHAPWITENIAAMMKVWDEALEHAKKERSNEACLQETSEQDEA